MSPLDSATEKPIEARLLFNASRFCADSEPVESLLSYKMYLLLTSTGDRFGMTTFAPARIPFSLPSGSIEPRAVVAGSRMFGFISLINDSRKHVKSAEPARKPPNGVSFVE